MTLLGKTPLHLLAASAALALAACSAAPKATGTASRPHEALGVQQKAPIFVDVDTKAAGKTVGDLTFILGGEQLLVKGASGYPRADREMEVNKPQVRALVGGTGSFVGVDGDVSIVRNADGAHTHAFRLMR